MSGEPKTLTLEEFLIRDNAAMRRAGCELAEAALRVIREYDGTHRLALAAAAWTQTIADEGGRGDMHSGVRVVARDEAAELRAENERMRKALAAVDSFLSHEYHRNGHRLTGKEWAADVLRQVEVITRRRLAGGESEEEQP